MQLRFLEYFIALAEEKHFARAAERCNVTQPTLSAGIAALEGLLGKRLVLRDRRFIDLTPEGHAILPHARQLTANHEELRQAIDAAGPLQGEFRLGVIPAAMPYVGRFVGALHEAHPALRVAIRQMTSDGIVRGLANFELDSGLTYLDAVPLPGLITVPLYSERYRLAVRADNKLADRKSVTMAEAIAEPLCLLHQGMQNRRILDGHLARLRLAATPVATSDSYVALLSMVANGLASIVTDAHAAFIAPTTDIRLIEISDVATPNRVGLIVPERAPISPIAGAALAIGRDLSVIDTVDQQ